MESNTVCSFNKWEIEDSFLSSRRLQFLKHERIYVKNNSEQLVVEFMYHAGRHMHL